MEEKKSIVLIVGAVVIAAAVGVAAWYFQGIRPKNVAAPRTAQPIAGAPAPASDLGSSIYEHAKNPIQGKLPASVAPVTNPIQGVYKNPFE